VKSIVDICSAKAALQAEAHVHRPLDAAIRHDQERRSHLPQKRNPVH
jgi:hypothetical protein